MSKGNEVEFANFICRFGEEKVLLDLASEIVIPAFLSTDLLREYGDTRYFFFQTKFIELQKGEKPIIAIAGRFVKDTVLEREQIYDEKKGLVPDHESIRSAPSAIFLLILNNHKLVYLHETADAPSLSTFRSTSEKFIRVKHKEYIDKLYKKKSEQGHLDAKGEKITKRGIIEEFPYPHVEAIPLSSEATLKEFIAQFFVLRSAQVRLVQTNDELDLNGFFMQVRGTMDDIGSKQTTLTHKNPEGLSKAKAIRQLSTVVKQGNAVVKLSGKDELGDTLNGNNDSFKVRVPMKQVDKEVGKAAVQMYKAFQQLINKGTLQISDISEKAVEKTKLIRDRFRS